MKPIYDFVINLVMSLTAPRSEEGLVWRVLCRLDICVDVNIPVNG